MNRQFKYSKVALFSVLMALNISSVSANNLDPMEQAILEAQLAAKGMSHFKLDEIIPNPRYQHLIRANTNIFGSCGSFDPVSAVSQGFSVGNITAMFDAVVKNAKGAVTGMAGRMIQEANPGLFNFIQKGIDIGFSDYLSALDSCEGVQNLVVNNTPSSIISKASLGEKLNELGKVDTDIDLTSLMKSKMLRNGNSGVKGVDGKQYGGKTSAPLEVVSQTIRAGWCTLSLTSGGECANITNSSSTPAATTKVIKKMFPTALSAESFARDLVGEIALRSCEGCESIKSTPPQSIAQLIDAQTAISYNQINDLTTNNSVEQIKKRDLVEIGTSTYPITRQMIANLKQEKKTLKNGLMLRISSELATAKVMDKVIMLRQILLAGQSNSKLLQNESVQQESKIKLEFLNKSITQYRDEIELRKVATTDARNDSATRTVTDHNSDANISLLNAKQGR